MDRSTKALRAYLETCLAEWPEDEGVAEDIERVNRWRLEMLASPTGNLEDVIARCRACELIAAARYMGRPWKEVVREQLAQGGTFMDIMDFPPGREKPHIGAGLPECFWK